MTIGRIVSRIRREPALIGGILLASGQVLTDAPTWQAAVPLLVSLWVRAFVTPYYKPEV